MYFTVSLYIYMKLILYGTTRGMLSEKTMKQNTENNIRTDLCKRHATDLTYLLYYVILVAEATCKSKINLTLGSILSK